MRPRLGPVRLGAFVALTALLVLPIGSVVPSHPSLNAHQDPQGSASGLAATVTWNGKDVKGYAAQSSALSITFNHAIDVRYFWNSTAVGAGAPKPFDIGTARLQMIYFGLALSTRDVVDSNPQPAVNGSFDMTWDPGILRYLLEGSYLVTASLIAPNGTTMWSEGFYVHATAPYSLLAAVPVLLVMIALYELYNVATSGKYSTKMRSRRPPPSDATSADAAENAGGETKAP